MKLKEDKGFSLIEIIVVLAIIGILLAIAIPNFTVMRPRMRLKSAARGIVSDIQLAKAQALRDRKAYIIQFDTSGGRYIVSSEGITKKIVKMAEYSGVSFGSVFGKANDDKGPDDEGDGVTFEQNRIMFNADSTSNIGGVYLKNGDNMTYSVLCLSMAGGVKTMKNIGGSGWE